MPKVVNRSRKIKRKEETWVFNQKYRQGVIEIEELDTAGFKECQPYAETIKLRKMRRNLSEQRNKKDIVLKASEREGHKNNWIWTRKAVNMVAVQLIECEHNIIADRDKQISWSDR
jgi:hypothetical protein